MRALSLAILVLAPLAACDADHWHGSDPELAVTNNGAVAMRVEVDDGHDHLYLVSPGERRVRDLASFWIEVRITRESDGLLLFAEDFEPEDFDDHDRIEIAVHP